MELIDRARHLLDPATARDAARRHPRAAGVLHHIEVALRLVRDPDDPEIATRAASLTYRTLLSLVPTLAIAFAAFHALGGLRRLKEPLQQLIVRNIAFGQGDQVGQTLDRFIDNIDAGAIAGVGALGLAYTAIGLLTAVEDAMNRVWGVRRTRPLAVRVVLYLAMTVVLPPLVAVSVSVSAWLASSGFAGEMMGWLPPALGAVLLSAASLVSVCAAFTLAYRFLPNTAVTWRAALAGGAAAALVWQGVKAAFLAAYVGSVQYSAIYGALGAIPLLMIWVYLSWVVVLFGARYAALFQGCPGVRR
jgi:membrane protein